MTNKKIIFIFFLIFTCLTIILFFYFLSIVLLKRKINAKLITTNNLINEFKQKWCWIYLEFAKKIFEKINNTQNIDIKIIIENIQNFITEWNEMFSDQNKKISKNVNLFFILKIFFYINKNKNVFYSIYNKLDEVINLQTIYCVQELNENFILNFQLNNKDQLETIKLFLINYLNTDDKLQNHNYKIIKKNILNTTSKEEINKLVNFINLENKKTLGIDSKTIKSKEQEIYKLLEQQIKITNSFSLINFNFKKFLKQLNNKDDCERKN